MQNDVGNYICRSMHKIAVSANIEVNANAELVHSRKLQLRHTKAHMCRGIVAKS